MIFVNSMSDLFHEDIPASFIADVFDVMVRAEHHTFQVLTKRHERLAELGPDLPWPVNVWMGVTIENRRFVHRADYLRRVPAAIRFMEVDGSTSRLLEAERHQLLVIVAADRFDRGGCARLISVRLSIDTCCSTSGWTARPDISGLRIDSVST